MIHFFGDSWPAENGEYNDIMMKKFDSYPVMVGKLTNCDVKNHALSGSSQEHMILQFLKSDICPGDTAVFSLTAPSRRFLLDDQNNEKHLSVDGNKEGVNDYNDHWISFRTILLLYQMCQSQNITPWFINTFNVCYVEAYDNGFWSMIPEECWILPKDKCIINMLFDQNFFQRYNEYRNSDFYEWLSTDNEQVKKFIRPCQDHPNLEGRKIIAEKIAAVIYRGNN